MIVSAGGSLTICVSKGDGAIDGLYNENDATPIKKNLKDLIYAGVGTVADNSDYNGYSIYEAFVKSNDMTKPFVIEVQKDGRTYTMAESVQAYAERLLGNTNNAEVKTLLVDMLNYGAEAQKYFVKANTGLANERLTAEQ